MEITCDLCVCLMRLIIVCFVGFICFVCSDERCRDEEDKLAREGGCVSDLSCQQFEDRIDVSWNPPQDMLFTLDFVIKISNVTIDGWKDKVENNNSRSLRVLSSQTQPNINPVLTYTVSVKRRDSNKDINSFFSITKECTKAYGSTSRTSVTDGLISENQVTMNAIDKDNVTSDLSRSYGIIIGLSVAVFAVAIIIIILAVRYAKKKKSGKVNRKPPREKPRDDIRGLKDDINEDDTYNRLTLRYQENTAKQERVSQDTYAHITETETQGQGENLPQAAHAPITHHYDGNYDDIPFEFEKTEKTETASTNEPLMQDKPKVEDSKSDDVKGPLTGDVYASVDKGNTQQIEDGLNRAEGPQGDLYTEVAIKR